jgi:hypothetical protein
MGSRLTSRIPLISKKGPARTAGRRPAVRKRKPHALPAGLYRSLRSVLVSKLLFSSAFTGVSIPLPLRVAARTMPATAVFMGSVRFGHASITAASPGSFCAKSAKQYAKSISGCVELPCFAVFCVMWRRSTEPKVAGSTPAGRIFAAQSRLLKSIVNDLTSSNKLR